MDTGKKDELEPDFAHGSPPGEEGEEGEEGEDEVWFEAQALAQASEVELGGTGLLRAGYAVEDLAADRVRRGIDLGALPAWPDGPASGHGWGAALTGLVGTLRRGDRLLVDAPGPGHGRSGFVLQLADGLALRNHSLPAGDPLTPVVVVAEEGREEAGRRSLARWTGHEARVFRHGLEGARHLEGWSPDRVERAFADAARALDAELGGMSQFCRFVGVSPHSMRGAELVSAIADAVTAWCVQLQASGRETWPVVVIDGLHPLASPDDGLEATVRALSSAAQRGGWILLASERAIGDRLDPWFDLRLVLDAALEPEHVHARVAHHRGGPSGGSVRYAWSPGVGRYEPAD